MASSDPFDDVLNLEQKFYSDGHKQGVADGERAGRTEGRSFGIEKGFEKFLEAGRMYGKAVVWANRLPQSQAQSQQDDQEPEAAAPYHSAEAKDTQQARLPVLRGGGARLEKNVVMLHALVEPETLSTENADEAVNDFDDRVKRAQGKTRVIERQIGEDASSGAAKKDGVPLAAEVKSGGGKQASSSAAAPTMGNASF